MTSSIRRCMLLSAVSLAVGGVTGCSYLGFGDSSIPAQTQLAGDPPVANPPVAPSPVSFASTEPAEPAPKPANTFGEFDVGPQPSAIPSAGTAGFQQHTWLDEGYDSHVVVSPDGRHLLFSSTRHSERPDIYLQRVDGQSVTQITADAADDAFPAFSPDGQKIAFASNRNGSWDIFTSDLDGRNVTQITFSPSQDIHPSFSPDGSKLVYCSAGTRSGQWELWTIELSTGVRKMIGFGLFPTWSPDKSRDIIAFQRARQRGSRWFSIWTLELIDGEARRISEVAVSANAALVTPQWSPDGKRLTFATVVDPARESAGKPNGQRDIWTVNLDGTGRHRLTDGIGTSANPFWARDNRVYFISDRGGAEAVWSVQADGPNYSTAAVPKD